MEEVGRVNNFYFSIVMAVYNVEEYLQEAIECLLNQTLSFKDHVQLILINDGSIDNSKEICIKYKEKYPNNIVFIDKENGGVSSARNAGLEVCTGKYVNFLDPDDKLSPEALQEVYNFFETVGKDVDVVSIPIIWFDQAKGQHLLNYKFGDDRIINIFKEYQSIQMSSSSSFVRRSAIGENRFNGALKYGEDAEWLNRIILDKCEFGVVSKAKYLYRKRATETSATQRSLTDKDYYLHSLENFSFSLVNVSLQKLGFVPFYIQYMIIYDLQWRLNNNNISAMLDEEELNKYEEKLAELLSYINDDIIMAQKNLNLQRKNYLLMLKNNQNYNEFFKEMVTSNDAVLLHKDELMDILSSHRLAVELINIEKGVLQLQGHFLSLFNSDNIRIFAKIKDQEFEASYTNRYYKDINVFGKNISKAIGFTFNIPIAQLLDNKIKVTFYVKYLNANVLVNLLFGGLSYLNSSNHSYYRKEQFIVTYSKKSNCLVIEKYNFKKILKKELKVSKYLYRLNKVGSRKAILARLIHIIESHFNKKPIWLFMDRVNKADDNAEVLFEYALKQSDGIEKYFIINKNCQDYHRLKKIGKVVPYGSRKHKRLILLADKLISSHADEFIINPFRKMKKYYKDLMTFDFVFLQHGITKDDMSGWLNKFKKNIRLFITAGKLEYQSIIEGNYDYEKKEVILSGFPRFDKLINNSQKRILIMPTWRSHIVSKINPLTGERKYNPLFKETEFFKAFNDLLNHPKLLQTAKEKGYKLIFFPHPNILQQLEDYTIDPSIEVADLNSSYRDHFIKSSVLVTDYSSVAFDFAYLKKPVIYYQFEKNHLESGYFDYHTMGFGEVLAETEDVVNKLIDYMNNDCIMEPKFIKRVEDFYAYTDDKNSERVYNEILNINH